MTLGFLLFLMALLAIAVVIWDYEQKWDEPYDTWEDDDEGF